MCSAIGDTSRQPKPFCTRGQFLLIWMTLVLCSEQRLCDFYLRLWWKIRGIVNRFHWCSAPFLPPPPLPSSSLQFRLWYNGLKKEKMTSQRWHFNSCWADKNNTPLNINSALWTHPKIMLCVSVDVKTETGKMWCSHSDDVMSAASLNGCLKTQGQRTRRKA